MAAQRRSLLAAGLAAIMVLWATPSLLAAEAISPEERARDIIEATGTSGGLIVHLGCNDGRLTAALRVNESYAVHGLAGKESQVRQARKHLRSLGICGSVSVQQWDADYLPYTDNLVNLLVAEDPMGVPENEMMRALAPGGVAYIKRGDAWEKKVKPRPEDIDEWTHFLHDASGNAVAQDSQVGPPRHMQWMAKPLYCRHHEIDSSISALVAANGRLFYILDEGLPGVIDPRLPARWSLVARDAFSGVLLWKRPIPEWGWQQWKKSGMQNADWSKMHGHRLRSPAVLPRRLVARGDRVYVTLGYDAPLTVLDAATGEVEKTYDDTRCADEILLTDDTLLLCTRKTPATGTKRRTGHKPPESILAMDPDSGEIRWRHDEDKILPLTLTAGEERVVLHDYTDLICLDLDSGEELWRTKVEVYSGGRFRTWKVLCTVVVRDGVVLFSTLPKLKAFSAEDGELLWSAGGARGPGGTTPDLFVIDDLVWFGGPDREWNMKNPQNVMAKGLQETVVTKKGHDLHTGEVKRTVTAKNLIANAHHFRCYRSKATERYILWPKRGVEFLDVKGSNFDRCDWLRGACRLGYMPANGLLYMPPHQCFCYPEAKLNGFNALDSHLEYSEPSKTPAGRLVKGRAFDDVEPTAANPEDWPTYRHDRQRSGKANSPVKPALERAWEADLGGELTQPIVVGDRLFVASVDTHTLHCLTAGSGRPVWQFTAGGQIDSPPTYFRGRLLFGSADGWVYCLRADDGTLAWRFRAAPSHRKVVRFGQVESAWRVHGSVLVVDGVAYCTAGRSTYLDGGIYIYGLDPATGETLHEHCFRGPFPDLPDDPGWAFHMKGARSEVLVSDGEYIYLRQAQFTKDLKKIETERITRLGDRRVGHHLFSTASLLDDTWWNRTYWMNSARWPGYYHATHAPKTGQILVFDDAKTYGLKVYKKGRRPLYFPGQGCELFADDNDAQPVLKGNAPNWDKGPGFDRSRPPLWNKRIPVRMRGLVLAGETLFGAGPPDEVPEDDPMASFEGKLGSRLWAVNAATGEKLAEYNFESVPEHDGLIAANGSLYMSTQKGKIICLKSR